jgi:hypothetical protein
MSSAKISQIEGPITALERGFIALFFVHRGDAENCLTIFKFRSAEEIRRILHFKFFVPNNNSYLHCTKKVAL